MRERGLDNDPTLAVYFPGYGTAFGSMQIVMHTRGRPQDVIPAARTVVSAVDPNLPISGIRTLEEIVSSSVATRRMTMMLAAILIFGVAACYIPARRVLRVDPAIALRAE